MNTVAAGGGSQLFFRSGMFVVGPESAGAHPGESFISSVSMSPHTDIRSKGESGGQN